LTNLINLCDEVTSLVDEGRAVDVAYLDFRKAFHAVCYKLLVDKLLICGLDKQTVRRVENCWKSWPQSVMTSGMKSSWRPVSSDVLKE